MANKVVGLDHIWFMKWAVIHKARFEVVDTVKGEEESGWIMSLLGIFILLLPRKGISEFLSNSEMRMRLHQVP